MLRTHLVLFAKWSTLTSHPICNFLKWGRRFVSLTGCGENIDSNCSVLLWFLCYFGHQNETQGTKGNSNAPRYPCNLLGIRSDLIVTSRPWHFMLTKLSWESRRKCSLWRREETWKAAARGHRNPQGKTVTNSLCVQQAEKSATFRIMTDLFPSFYSICTGLHVYVPISYIHRESQTSS